MEDECYPAISMNTATSNTRRLLDSTTLTQNSSSQFGTSIQNGSNLVHTSLRQSNNKQQPLIDQQPQQNQLLQQNQSICSAQLDTASISSSDVDIDDSFIKDEPMSPSSSCPSSPHSQSAYGISLNMSNVAALTNSDLVFEHKNGSLQLSPASHSLLKNQQIILSGTPTSNSQQQRIVMPKLSVKMESQSTPQFGLPPTPPSSLPSDESEGNRSPEHNSPMSPPISQQPQQHCSTLTISSRRSTTGGSSTSSSSSSSPASHLSSSRTGYSVSSTRQPIHTPLISSQPKGSTGTLVLTEEEKRTLLAEGYPIPTRLPLTKAEEKSLKKIRRKIKNKISAQESRRKKKEYMDQLERKVEILVSENSDYRKRVETLEDSNANLMSQLAKLQSMLNRQNQKRM